MPSSSHKPIYVPKGISRGRAKRLVYEGVYKKTRGGLTQKDLTLNRLGKVVSRKKLQQGKKLQQANPYKKNPRFLSNIIRR
jgi:hypothetical protein